MAIPVFNVQPGHIGRPQNQQVFGVLLFRRLREIVRACYHGLSVDYHDLVVRNSMTTINIDLNTCASFKKSKGPSGRSLRLVKNDSYINALFVCVGQRSGDFPTREGISLHQYF